MGQVIGPRSSSTFTWAKNAGSERGSKGLEDRSAELAGEVDLARAAISEAELQTVVDCDHGVMLRVSRREVRRLMIVEARR